MDRAHVTGDLEILIVSYNTRADLAVCLQSLHDSPPARLARITVVDSASTDGTVEALAGGWPNVRWIRLDRNIGFGAANNAGLRQASAPLVLLLNPDTIVPAGAIDRLAARLEATGATAAGPRLVDASGRAELSFGPMLTPWGEARQWLRGRAMRSDWRWLRRYGAALVGREQLVDWVTGACLLVRHEAALAAGLFDERFFLYEEDVDFCAALRAGGGRVLFTPAAEVVHLRGRSQPAVPSKGPRHYDRSHVLFYEKHAPRWVPWLKLWLGVRRRSVR